MATMYYILLICSKIVVLISLFKIKFNLSFQIIKQYHCDNVVICHLFW